MRRVSPDTSETFDLFGDFLCAHKLVLTYRMILKLLNNFMITFILVTKYKEAIIKILLLQFVRRLVFEKSRFKNTNHLYGFYTSFKSLVHSGITKIIEPSE